jgi:hypothetical protein
MVGEVVSGGYNPNFDFASINADGFMPTGSSIGSGSGSGSWFSGDSFLSGGKGGGLEGLGGIGGVAQILGELGNVWNGFQQQKLAKKTLNFQKDAFNKNFNANRMAYNARVEDTLRARSSQTGQNYDNIIAERRL